MGPPRPSHPQTRLEQIGRLRSRSERRRTGFHYAEGIRNVLEALAAAVPVETIVYSEILCRSPIAQKTVRLRKRDGTDVLRVTPEEFRRISTTLRASGIGAVLRQRWTPLERIDPHRGLCWIVLRRLRSPGNLGTILRTAEAVGAAGIIFLGEDADPFDPDVVRASMGGLFRLQIVRTTMGTFSAWARSRRCTVLGMSPSARDTYTEVALDPPLAVILGEERAGLSPEDQAACTCMARIPIAGRADSLNVGVAAGVMLYEILRRRR